MRVKECCIALMTAALCSALGDTIDWIGSEGYWDDASSWQERGNPSVNRLPTAADEAYMGRSDPPHVVTLTNGVDAKAKWLYVSEGGVHGRLIMDGGTLTVGKDYGGQYDGLHLANQSWGTGILELNDGILDARWCWLGGVGGAVGTPTWIQNGGAAYVAEQISLGGYAGAIYLNDGLLSSAPGTGGWLTMGGVETGDGTVLPALPKIPARLIMTNTAGNAVFNMGTLEAKALSEVLYAAGQMTVGGLVIGGNSSGRGYFKMADGVALTNLGTRSPPFEMGGGDGDVYGGEDECGIALFEQVGGVHRVANGTIHIGTSGNARYHLTGGGVFDADGRWMIIGNGGTGTAFLDIDQDSTLLVSELTIGSGVKTGVVNLASGTILCNTHFILSKESDSSWGKFVMTGGALTNGNPSSDSNFYVENGEYRQSGGTVFTLKGARLGQRSVHARGFMYLSGDAELQIGGGIEIGHVGYGRVEVGDNALFKVNGAVRVGGWGVNSTGVVVQTGGRVEVPETLLGGNDGTTGVFGYYTISGGILTNSSSGRGIGIGTWEYDNSNCGGEFNIIGGAAQIYCDILRLRNYGTLNYFIHTNGLSPIQTIIRPSLNNGGDDIGGVCRVAFYGGLGLLATNQYVVIAQPGEASPAQNIFPDRRNFYGVFSFDPESYVGLVATLGTNHRKWNVPSRFRRRWTADAPCTKGWGEMTFAGCPDGALPVLLKLDLTGSGKSAEDVCDYIRQAGYAAETIAEKFGYDIKIYIPTPAGTDSGYFAWDFEPFDPDVMVTGVKFSEPDDIGTIILLR